MILLQKPQCVDLFAGAGGMSLGFEQAGCKVIAAIEIDDWAADTYEANLPTTSLTRADISELDEKYFKQFVGADIVMGGPPCQGFSISASNRRKKHDTRNYMYVHFIRAIKTIRPRILLVENVKEIINAKLHTGESLLEDFIARLGKLGYNVSYNLINSKYLGVPQERIRCFMIGSRRGTVSLDMKKTFTDSPDLFLTNSPLTLNNALSDLPTLDLSSPPHEGDVLEYGTEPANPYQKMLRENSIGVINHVPMKHTKRIVERFKLISLGTSMIDLPNEHSARQRGNPEKFSGKVFHQNHRRLDPSIPCRTITASFYSSFIHPFEHRNLTVREAARIQSFPDTFKFSGKRTTLSHKLLAKKGIIEDIHLDQFNQVGNAVPPLVAKRIAEKIIEDLSA